MKPFAVIRVSPLPISAKSEIYMFEHLAKTATASALLALAGLATPALAQTDDTSSSGDWTGAYIGGSLGHTWVKGQRNESIKFDTNADGTFGDQVTTSGGANAFSPGFCDGAAVTNAPAGGCRRDKDGTAWNGHIGYDKQFGGIVAGIVVEGGKAYVSDSVSAFSVTPASYTMTRRLGWNGTARARLGFTPGGNTLVYATGGGAYGRFENSFATTNMFNTFTQSNVRENRWGWVAGGGIEQKVSRNFSIGVLYKYTRFGSSKYRVNAGQGTPPSATNAFVITPAGSTNFARDSRFETHGVQVTASFRF
jgi:outer membrane immunogenic protein